VLAKADVELTLVDDGEPGGGLCILRGCMPSKEVLSAAAHAIRQGDHRLTGVPEVDLEAVVRRKTTTCLFADTAARESRRWKSARTSRSATRPREFVDDCVRSTSAATGSNPTTSCSRRVDAERPDLPGVDEVDWMGSADTLDATAFPDSGVVMGFGYVGLELVPPYL